MLRFLLTVQTRYLYHQIRNLSRATSLASSQSSSQLSLAQQEESLLKQDYYRLKKQELELKDKKDKLDKEQKELAEKKI